MTVRRIAVVHGDLSAGGGAESYAQRVIDVCRANGFEVTVIDVHTMARELGERGLGGRLLAWTVLRMRSLEALTYACVLRWVKSSGSRADLYIFSYGECGAVPMPHVRILHAPAMYSTDTGHLEALGVATDSSVRMAFRRTYVRLCRKVAGDPRVVGDQCLATVANSRWTARLGTAQHRAPLHVVYPPVVPPAVHEGSTRRADQVVMIGRLVANKRHRAALAIVRAAAAASQRPLQLLVIGRGSGRYARRLSKESRRTSDLTVSMNAPAADVARALAGSRVGLHAYRHEHFGIAVAEMILAGCIPLVHDGGGVAELVVDERCRYSDDDHAARQLERLIGMSTPDCEQLREELAHGPALEAALDFDQRFSAVLTGTVARLDAQNS